MAIGSYVALAAKLDAGRRLKGGSLERYLQREFRGGSSVEAIRAETHEERDALGTVLARSVRQLRLRRLRTDTANVAADE